MYLKPGFSCRKQLQPDYTFLIAVTTKTGRLSFTDDKIFIIKQFIPFIVVVLLTACTKENGQDSQMHLNKITVNSKTHENFEYNSKGQLKKEDGYNFCTVPSDEFTYVYTNKKLDSVKLVNRSLYSSSAFICNPQLGFHSYSAFEYDNVGRISKIKKEDLTVEYTYNSGGQVEKQTLNGGGTNLYISTFKYDARGNLVEKTDSQGNITQYEFDDKINPNFLMKRRPDVLIAFFVSPNNVVKIKNPGSAVVEIKYEYNQLKMTTKMFDPNGLTYVYVYN